MYHTQQQLTRIALGTPICCSEARGLRQGPRAGGQVEEVGRRTTETCKTHGSRGRRATGERRPDLLSVCGKKQGVLLHPCTCIYPARSQNKQIQIFANLFKIEIQHAQERKTSRQPNPKRLHAYMRPLSRSHLRSSATSTRRQPSQPQPSSSQQPIQPSQPQASATSPTAPPAPYAHI